MAALAWLVSVLVLAGGGKPAALTPQPPARAYPGTIDGDRDHDPLGAEERLARQVLGTAPACAGGCSALAWTALASVPAGIEGACASLIDSKLYLSHPYTGTDTGSLYIYDIASNTWSSGPGAQVARSEGTGAAAGGKHYAIGGRSLSTGILASVEVFDPVTGTWGSAADLPHARAGLGVAVLDGRIHAVGGRSGAAPRSGTPLAWHEVYDPVTDTWTARADLPTPVGDCYAAAALDGKLYVFGGWNGSGDESSTQIYDDATDSWSLGATMPTARSNALAGVLAGKIAVIGGEQGGPPDLNLSVVEVYDPATDSWCAGPDKPTAASEMATGTVSDGQGLQAVGSGKQGQARDFHEVLTAGAGPDSQPPTLECPAGLTLECPANPAAIDAWLGSATASDDCTLDPAILTTLVSHQAACGNTYQDTYEFKATDAAGNASTCRRTVAVVDTTGPVLAGLPSSTTVACDAVPFPVPPAATDACGPDPQVDLVETKSNEVCADGYTLTRTWTATDACGNATTGTQVLTVRDTQAPAIPGAPGDETVECDGVPNVPAVQPIDDCDPVPSLSFEETRFDGSCPDAYQLLRQWTARDRCGNGSVYTQEIDVADTTPPTLVPPAPLALECNAGGGVSATDPRIQAWVASAIARDNCASPAVVNDAPALFSSGCAPGSSTSVAFAADDDCGNRAESDSSVTVSDTTPPDLSGCGLVPLLPLAPRTPRSVSSAGCAAAGTFSVRCGVAADLCDTQPVTRTAQVIVEGHGVSNAACVSTLERVAVECDEVVDIQLVSGPCPTRPPRDPRPALSVVSGRKVITGERVKLEVTAADGCANLSQACIAVPALCAPAPARCPGSAACGF